MTKNFKASFKKFLTIVCAMTLVFSAFAVSASETEDEKPRYIYDSADVMNKRTEDYIEYHMKGMLSQFDGSVIFLTVKGDSMPKNILDLGSVPELGNILEYITGGLNEKDDETRNIILWVDGADKIKLFSTFGTDGDDYYYSEADKAISQHIKNMDDHQAAIRDAFSIYMASRFYFLDKLDEVPDTLTVGAIDAKVFTQKEFGQNQFVKKYAGPLVLIGVVGIIIFIFAKNKTPEGTVPGDGSNFKDGIGSGVAAMTGMPGQHGYTTGMGSLGAGPRG